MIAATMFHQDQDSDVEDTQFETLWRPIQTKVNFEKLDLTVTLSAKDDDAETDVAAETDDTARIQRKSLPADDTAVQNLVTDVLDFIAARSALQPDMPSITVATHLPTRYFDGRDAAQIVFKGADAGDNAGRFVAAAGDFNGDGLDDYIIGANRAQPNGNGSGETYLIFGRAGGDASTTDLEFNLGRVDGTNGIKLNGIDSSDNSGKWIAGGGDLNGDGFDDIIITARRGDPDGQFDAGETYVVFGRASEALPSEFELAELNGRNGFTIGGVDINDQSGRSAAFAGDINGDGIDDLVIGARTVNQHGGSGPSEAYVVFGHDGLYHATFDLADLDGTNGFTFFGVENFGNVGSCVSGIGDINNDGIDDVAFGADFVDGNGADAGAVYVVYGTTEGFSASMTADDIDGENGFLIVGPETDARAGKFVTSAGDVNGDGIDDFVVGAPGTDAHDRTDAGQSYLIFGQTGNFDALMDLGDLDGTNGVTFHGAAAGDHSGNSIDAAGDLNGDGFDDLIIGSFLSDEAGTDSGAYYIFWGSGDPFDAEYDLASLAAADGLAFTGGSTGDHAARSVAGVGDVNGDGLDDILVGAPEADPNGRDDAGEAYLIMGREMPNVGMASVNYADVSDYY